jgi:protease-4
MSYHSSSFSIIATNTSIQQGATMRFLFNTVKQLFIKLFKLINYVRLFILNALFLLLVFIIFFSFTDKEEVITVDHNSYLNLNLDGFLVEQKQPVNFSLQLSKQLSGDDDIPQEFEVQEVINVIHHAQNNPRITGMILQLNGLRSGSLDQLTDIGNAINSFKATNKKVIAYAENYSQTQYYLAAYADQITLAPNGGVFLQGYAVNRLYFKNLIDNLLITPHIFKVGTYKSFVEPFTDTKMSDYSKEANYHWLNQLWQNYIAHVLEERSDIQRLNIRSINPTLKQLKEAIQTASGDSAKYALNAGLVDNLMYYDQFIDAVKLSNKIVNTNKVNIIDYHSYASITPPIYPITGSKNQIAVIHGTGEIIAGQSDTLSIADESFNKLLKQTLNNKHIKAVVIRLDTPGGSAFASENIRQQVLTLKNAGKKVVVSMGSVTASGGYWIASAADRIVASPTTLTGSIGIFGMFATIDKSLNKIGINQDGISTNPLANLSMTQPLNPELAEIFQIAIEGGYQKFIKVVSEGRNMRFDTVEKVAQGRVWTGYDALNNGLVDELGNLQSAINIAADLASITNYDIVTIKAKTSSKQAFINSILSTSLNLLPSGIVGKPPLLDIMTTIDTQTNFLTRLNDPQNRFVYCSICFIK